MLRLASRLAKGPPTDPWVLPDGRSGRMLLRWEASLHPVVPPRDGLPMGDPSLGGWSFFVPTECLSA
jgi:hypothetical protein